MRWRHAQLLQARLQPMPQLGWNRNTGPRVRAHSASQALTPCSSRQHSATYSIQAPYVFNTIIRLSNAQHGPIQITSVDAGSTQSDVRIRIQTVKSVAERYNVRNTRLKGMASCAAEARLLYTDIVLKWKAAPQVKVHAACQVLTFCRCRRHTATYRIQAPYVFDKSIRLSKAKHGPIQITSVDAESTHSDVRIQIQTVKSVACAER